MKPDQFTPCPSPQHAHAGSGDNASFQRLEAAVEYLADAVAAAPPGNLKRAAEQLQRRFAAIQREHDALVEVRRSVVVRSPTRAR